MSKKHQHAPLMLAYAEDSTKTDKPWLLWEYSESGDNWWPLKTHPIWSNTGDYRRRKLNDWILRYLNGEKIQFTHEKTDIVHDEDWFDVDKTHEWDAAQYRVKSEKSEKSDFIKINGRDVPRPISKCPDMLSEYWSVADMRLKPRLWRGSIEETSELQCGLVHLVYKNAVAHVNALISFTDDSILI